MKNIALIPNSGKDKELVRTKQIAGYLSDKADVYMDKAYRGLISGVNYIFGDELYKKADYAVVLGGDGTILQLAAQCAKENVPVLGINLGKIGFMTEIEPQDAQSALERLLEGAFEIENRMMIKAEIKRGSENIKSFHALNDIVISKSVGEKLVCIELRAGTEAVNRYISDGLIIATPTGSTGYSISAGGPVVDPSMRLFVATPICAHMLSVRSAVLSTKKEMRISIDSMYGGQEAVVAADGDVQGCINDGDEVIITESGYDFGLIKIGNQSFYDTLIKKLS